MLYIYTFPEILQVLLCVLALLGAGMAALALVLHHFRFKRDRDLGYWLESAAVFFALCQTLINTALIAQAQRNTTYGYVTPSGYALPRQITFVALAALFISLCILCIITGRRRRAARIAAALGRATIRAAIAAAASFLVLPSMETWTGRDFPTAYIASTLILLFGGIWISFRIRGELRKSISNLSIKQAMDTLDTGILFYKKKGHILLQNERMSDLMIKTSGGVYFNAELFVKNVVIPKSEHQEDGSYLFRLSDSVWLFSVSNILGKKITRLIAANVSEQDREIRLLEEKREELDNRQQQLKNFVMDIERISRFEYLLRFKADMHDVYNTKLTTLLQYIRYGYLPEGESFDTLSESVLHGINEIETVPPNSMLKVLVCQYERKGVRIQLTGELPPEQDAALALVQILQEAVANSITHGYANEVYADILDDNSTCSMRVTDNSLLHPKEIHEGGGIAGMRQRAEKLGGSLEIYAIPRFTVTAKVSRISGEERAN